MAYRFQSVSIDRLYFNHFPDGIKSQKSKLIKRPAPPQRDEFPIDKFRAEITRHFPPTAEIARLAAILAGERQINPESASIYARQAIGLWEKCEEERTKEISRLASIASVSALQAKRETLPKPKQFPASFDEALRLWMPGKRIEDREKCYRDYVIYNIDLRKITNDGEGENPDITTEEEAVSWIASDRKHGFKRVHFDFVSEQFQRWLPKYKAENRRKRARAGAIALKNKRQKNG